MAGAGVCFVIGVEVEGGLEEGVGGLVFFKCPELLSLPEGQCRNAECCEWDYEGFCSGSTSKTCHIIGCARHLKNKDLGHWL